jgi:hypothetical protein
LRHLRALRFRQGRPEGHGRPRTRSILIPVLRSGGRAAEGCSPGPGIPPGLGPVRREAVKKSAFRPSDPRCAAPRRERPRSPHTQ